MKLPIVALLACGVGITQAAELHHVVNDIAHLLSSTQILALERKVMTIEARTVGHPQVAILLVNRLPPDDDMYDTLNAMGIGDNGVLLMVAKLDHAVGIATGDRVAAVFTTAEKNIIQIHFQSRLTPGKEDWYRAVDNTVDAIAVGLRKLPPPDNEGYWADAVAAALVPLAIVLLIIGLIAFVKEWRRGRSRHRRRR